MNPCSIKKIKPTAQGDVDSGWREGSRPSLRATVNIPAWVERREWASTNLTPGGKIGGSWPPKIESMGARV